LQTAETSKSKLDASWREKDREANRLKRVQAALPLFAERRQILSDLKLLGEAVILTPEFSESRHAVQARLASDGQEVERAQRALAELIARREEISLAETLLNAEQDIESLWKLRGAYLKAQNDRPGLLALLQDHEHSAREILQSLGKPRDLAAAESLRLRVDEPRRITQLGRQCTELGHPPTSACCELPSRRRGKKGTSRGDARSCWTRSSPWNGT
jgi:hypothetical protein